MKIKSILITSIQSERTFSMQGPPKIQIKTGTSLKKITKSVLPIYGESVVIEFVFHSDYGKLGFLRIKGEVITDSNTVVENNNILVLKQGIKEAVLNNVIKRCLTIAFLLSRDMNFPPPINLPQIKTNYEAKKDEAHYIR